MKCKLSYEMSELVEYKNDPEHKYLKAVFVPVGMGLLQSLSAGPAAYFTLNIFPNRNAEGEINVEQEKTILEAFKNRSFEEYYYVDKVNVTVPPFLMTYSRDNSVGKKGEIIKDGNNPRKFDYVAITAFMVLKDEKEIPILSENALKSRALAVRRFRVKNNDWIDYESWLAENKSAIPEPSDDNLPVSEELNEDEEYREYLKQKRANAQKPQKL